MPNPLKSDVHVDKPLTNISIAYLQNATDFVASRVFPAVPVDKQSDKYFTFDRSYFWRDEMKKRALSTESAGGGYDLSTGSYSCDLWALHRDIDDQIRANYDSPLDPDREAVEYLTQQRLIRQDKQFVTDYMTASVWSKDVTGVSTGETAGTSVRQWNDNNSTPIEDIEYYRNYMKQLTGFFPNKLVMGYEVWSKLKNHPDIIDRIKYGQTPGRPAMTTKQAIAELMEVDEIVIAQAVENTGAEGGTASYSYIVGKLALLVYAAPRPGLMTPSGGYIFTWSGLLGAGTMAQRIARYRADLIKSDRLEIETAFDMKCVSADLGVLFSALVA